MPRKQIHVATVAAIRPDLIRLAPLIKRLDADPTIRHTFIHSGQHFDENLCGAFFKELELRLPDHNLDVGYDFIKEEHRSWPAQLIRLSQLLPDILTKDFNKPDLTLFLGDSNSVLIAPVLKKMGFRVGHIEAGMRSNDFRMPEEINRRCCDVASDYHFCYDESYGSNLFKEGLPFGNIYNVGNPIKETFNTYIKPLLRNWGKKANGYILVDLHRDELIRDATRLQEILKYCNKAGEAYNLPVLLLRFPRTMKAIADNNLNIGDLQTIDLLPYFKYMEYVHHAKFLISDSGTAQEEPGLLKTPVIVPRQYTERPLSMANGCSFLLRKPKEDCKSSLAWLDAGPAMDTAWLGDGKTSSKIVSIIKRTLAAKAVK